MKDSVVDFEWEVHVGPNKFVAPAVTCPTRRLHTPVPMPVEVENVLYAAALPQCAQATELMEGQEVDGVTCVALGAPMATGARGEGLYDDPDVAARDFTLDGSLSPRQAGKQSHRRVDAMRTWPWPDLAGAVAQLTTIAALHQLLQPGQPHLRQAALGDTAGPPRGHCVAPAGGEGAPGP